MKTAPQLFGMLTASLALAIGVTAQVQTEESQSLTTIRAKAEKGDAESQNALAHAFLTGSLGVAKDQAEAVKWFRKAAEQNDAPAQFGLGVCYANGQGVTKDVTEAVKWYRQAAARNNSDARFNLGLCFSKGHGVAKDEVKAVEYYRKAAEQNHTGAQCNLGLCYELGLGMPKDEVEAVKWYCKAAEQNYAPAFVRLGVCCEQGLGVPKDDAEAEKWFRKAAEQNIAQAQFALGVRYTANANPQGAQIVSEGYKWFLLAAAQGLPDAKKMVDEWRPKLRHDIIEKGEELARNFKPQELNSQVKTDAQALAEKAQALADKARVQAELQAKDAQALADKARVQAEQLQAKEAQAWAEVQAKINRMNAHEALLRQCWAAIAAALMIVWLFSFTKLLRTQGKAITAIGLHDLPPILKQCYKPLLCFVAFSLAGLIVVGQYAKSTREKTNLIQEEAAAKQLFDGIQSFSGSGRSQATARENAISSLNSSYKQYDIIATTWSTSSFYSDNHRQALREATHRYVAGMLSEPAYREIVLAHTGISDSDGWRTNHICTLTATHLVIRKATNVNE